MDSEYIYKREKTLKAIDLGLSVPWANQNFGDSYSVYYYSWGDLSRWTTERHYYLWKLKKKITCISGYPSYDVVAKETKKVWRIPTKKEWEELMNCCKWVWVNEGDEFGIINGFKIYGPNGNHIYLPVTGIGEGYVDGESFIELGDTGNYWAGNICKDRDHAYSLSFRKGKVYLSGQWRSRGCCIRPVYSPQ